VSTSWPESARRPGVVAQ